MVSAKLKKFIAECRRVLKVTRKPNGTELMTMVKVTGIGILLFGAIGFIFMIFRD